MGRRPKGVRLHKFDHRAAWYIRGGGFSDQSTRTDCFGRAVLELRSVQRQRAAVIPLPPIEDTPTLLSAVRKMIRKARDRSALKGQPIELTEANMLAMISEQGGRCALSGIEFSVTPSTAGRRLPFAPSPDRIDNTRGYTVDNVRIVCSIVNLAMGDFSDAEFARMCRGVADHG